MKIILVCQKTERLGPRCYSSTLKSVAGLGTGMVEVQMSGPLVPGEMYTVLLRGVMPGSQVNGPCVDDVCTLQVAGGIMLISATVEQELELAEAKAEGRA